MMNMRISRTRRSGGFTILELMVVIGIICLLIAVMGSMLNKLRERTKMAATRTLIEKVYSGLDQYKLLFRAYPPATAPGLTGDQALYYYITTTFSPTPIAANGEVWADLYCASCTKLEATETKKNGPGTDIIDAWAQPLIYKVTTQTDQYGIVTIQPIIYSCGPNKIDDLAAAGTDDVVIGR